MKEKKESYLYYEKLMKMKPEWSMVETLEYKLLAKHYPHLAESIRLKKEMKRLKKKLRSEKESSSRIQIEREINVTRAKLTQENILKRLFGESKQETFFRIHYLINTSKEHIQKELHRKLPPSVFDLKSLDTAEKGLALKEWLQSRYKKTR